MVNPWVPREKVPVRPAATPLDATPDPATVRPVNWASSTAVSVPTEAGAETSPAAPADRKADENSSGIPDRHSLATADVAPKNRTRVAWYASDRQRVDSLPPHLRIPVWKGPVRPHLGGRAFDAKRAGWWWLGVHGGAGVTTLCGFLPGGADAERCWPDPAAGGPNAVVLVCRTHLAGLDRARDAAGQWAASDVPPGLLLAGAVAVADAPGRLDRPQSEALRMLESVVPRLWVVPWIDDLRCTPAGDTLPLPPALLPLRADLEALRSSATARRS
jgi:hypothetical protein